MAYPSTLHAKSVAGLRIFPHDGPPSSPQRPPRHLRGPVLDIVFSTAYFSSAPAKTDRLNPAMKRKIIGLEFVEVKAVTYGIPIVVAVGSKTPM